MPNAIEMLITGRDASKPAFDQAAASVNRLTAVGGRIGPAMSSATSSVSRLGAEAVRAGSSLRSLEGGLGGLTSKLGALSSSNGALGGLGGGAGALAGALAGVAAGAVAAAGALTLMLRSAASNAEQVENLAEKAGIGASNVAALQLAAQQAGVGPEALGLGLRNLNKALAENDPLLKKLGVTSTNAEQALFQLADAFHNAPDGAAKTKAAIELLGRSGTDLIPILNLGSGALRTFIATAKGSGSVFSDAQFAGLKKLDDQFDQLGQAATGLRNQLVVAFLPLAEEAVPVAVKSVTALTGALKTVAPVLGDIGKVAGLAFKPMLFELDLVARGLIDLGSATAAAAKFLHQPTDAAEALVAAGLRMELALNRDIAAADTLTGTSSNLGNAVRSLGDGAKDTAKKLAELAEQFNAKTMPTVEVEKLATDFAAVTAAGFDTERQVRSLYATLGSVPKVAEVVKAAEQVRDSWTDARKAVEGLSQRKLEVLPPPKLQPTDKVPEFKPLTLSQSNLKKFREGLDEMAANVRASVDIMGAAFDGLASGINDAFQSIVQGGFALGKALTGIFRSMVSYILAELARLAASEVWKLFAKLVAKFLASLGSSGAGAPAAVFAGAIAAPLAPTAGVTLPEVQSLAFAVPTRSLPAPLALRTPTPLRDSVLATQARAVGNNVTNYFNVSTQDVRSFYESMILPSGPMRAAFQRTGRRSGF